MAETYIEHFQDVKIELQKVVMTALRIEYACTCVLFIMYYLCNLPCG